MSEEEMKLKYIKIANSLNDINKKIYQLRDNIVDMENIIKNNMLIDNEIPKKENIDDCYSNIDSSLTNIRDIIIPRINKKIYG